MEAKGEYGCIFTSCYYQLCHIAIIFLLASHHTRSLSIEGYGDYNVLHNVVITTPAPVLTMWPCKLKIEQTKVKRCPFGLAKWFWPNIFTHVMRFVKGKL